MLQGGVCVSPDARPRHAAQPATHLLWALHRNGTDGEPLQGQVYVGSQMIGSPCRQALMTTRRTRSPVSLPLAGVYTNLALSVRPGPGSLQPHKRSVYLPSRAQPSAAGQSQLMSPLPIAGTQRTTHPHATEAHLATLGDNVIVLAIGLLLLELPVECSRERSRQQVLLIRVSAVETAPVVLSTDFVAGGLAWTGFRSDFRPRCRKGQTGETTTTVILTAARIVHSRCCADMGEASVQAKFRSIIHFCCLSQN